MLATAKEAFSVAPGISDIHLLVIRAEDADARTPLLTPIAYVEFGRDAFRGINWENRSDAYDIVDRASYIMNFKGRTEEVSPLDVRDEPPPQRRD